MEYFSFLFNENSTISNEKILFSLGVFLGVFLVIVVIKFISHYLYGKISSNHPLRKDFFGILSNISWYSSIVFPLFFASLNLDFIKSIRIFIAVLFIISIVLEIGALTKLFLTIILEKGFRHQDQKTKKNIYEIVNTILQIFIWILAILIAFDTVGIAITPFLASLGVGSIAVAFAAQKLLEDFFSSFSIMSTAPFKIGDWISVEGYSGTVKKISLRATTIQTLEGSTVIIPNRSVVSGVIENSGSIKVRRKRFTLSITYETSPEKYKEIPQILEKIISEQEKTSFEWALLKDLSDSSIDILVSYTVVSDDLFFSLKIHDQILKKILEIFNQKGISFAYPTQTLYTHTA